MNIYFATGFLLFYILSCVVCGIFGYEYSSAKCKSKDEAHDMAQQNNTILAQQKVTKVVQTQNTISQEASKAYAKDYASILGLYTGRMQPAPDSTVNRVPPVRVSPAGACPVRSNPIAKSKVYQLTPQQCDVEEAKFNALWNWANKQALVH